MFIFGLFGQVRGSSFSLFGPSQSGGFNGAIPQTDQRLTGNSSDPRERTTEGRAAEDVLAAGVSQMPKWNGDAEAQSIQLHPGGMDGREGTSSNAGFASCTLSSVGFKETRGKTTPKTGGSPKEKAEPS